MKSDLFTSMLLIYINKKSINDYYMMDSGLIRKIQQYSMSQRTYRLSKKDPSYIVSYYIKSITTSWTYSIYKNCLHLADAPSAYRCDTFWTLIAAGWTCSSSKSATCSLPLSCTSKSSKCWCLQSELKAGHLFSLLTKPAIFFR